MGEPGGSLALRGARTRSRAHGIDFCPGTATGEMNFVAATTYGSSLWESSFPRASHARGAPEINEPAGLPTECGRVYTQGRLRRFHPRCAMDPNADRQRTNRSVKKKVAPAARRLTRAVGGGLLCRDTLTGASLTRSGTGTYLLGAVHTDSAPDAYLLGAVPTDSAPGAYLLGASHTCFARFARVRIIRMLN